MIFTIIVAFGAYYEIYFQYYTVHIEPYELNNRTELNNSEPATAHRSRGFKEHGNERGPYIDNTVSIILEKHGENFIIFIICFSYLIYNVAKTIQKDTAAQLERLSHGIGKFSSIVILFSLVRIYEICA